MRLKGEFKTYKVYINDLYNSRLLFSLRNIDNDNACNRAISIIKYHYLNNINRFNYFTIINDNKVIKTIYYGDFL